jgi:hypothetical protein
VTASRADVLAFLAVLRTCRRAGRVRIAEKAREEVALHGWDDEDVYLFLDELGPHDFLRREAPRYGAFDAIWVFTPAIVQPEGRLWIRLAQQGATLVVVVSFHPENFHEEESP